MIMTIGISTRVLVLDQDTLGENFLNQLLTQDGYEMIKVRSSTESLDISRTWKPDVIIINIMEPSSNGWKLCKKMKEHSQAPILVLAGFSDPNLIARWLDAGADDYLTKPCSSEILTAHLQKLTRRTRLLQNHSSFSLVQ